LVIREESCDMNSFKVTSCVLLVVGLAQSAPQGFSGNTNEVVRTVTTQLQPLISDAVAKALASFNSVSSVSSFGSSSRFGASSSGFGASSSGSATGVARGLSEEEEAEYNRKLSANAQYNYGYKVNDPDFSTFLSQEETRDGSNVQGQYSYVDSNGSLVTVTYTAGPDGYNEEREVQEGAVSGHAERYNVPWTGPYAGVSGSGVTAAAKTPAPVRAPVRAVAPAAPAVDQSALIQLILQQLTPQINSAVQSAISTTSSRSVSTVRAARPAAPSSVDGIFAGDNSVRIATPEFNIEY
jgi:hypothetical protein